MSIGRIKIYFSAHYKLLAIFLFFCLFLLPFPASAVLTAAGVRAPGVRAAVL